MPDWVVFWYCKVFLQGPDRYEFSKVLGLRQNAETSAMKQAYRRKCIEVHPDKLGQKGHR